MNAKTVYISAAINQVSHCLSIKEDILLYGACNAVVVAKFDNIEKSWETTNALVGHYDRVNCVKWIGDDYFVTGSTDKSVCVWKDYIIEEKLTGHEASVTCVNGLQNDNLIISGSADSSLRVWSKTDEKWNCVHIFQCPKSGFVLDIAILKGPDSLPWIFASFDDCTIRLFTFNGNEFTCRHILRGHEDWSQTLDVIFEEKNGSGDILLVSGSQDSFVRVWRFAKVNKDRALAERRKVSDLQFNEEIKAKEVIFSTENFNYFAVKIETILSGHEDKVFGVQWCKTNEKLSLLTASLDKTVILWQQQEENVDGLWIESVRVGEVGGNTLGFFGCQISQSGNIFTAYSFNGALHSWHHENNEWSPRFVLNKNYIYYSVLLKLLLGI